VDLGIVYLNDRRRAAGARDDAILDAVHVALVAQGTGEAVLEPRVHLMTGTQTEGHFNVPRGSIPALGSPP
jgi:alanine dehydrogenase